MIQKTYTSKENLLFAATAMGFKNQIKENLLSIYFDIVGPRKKIRHIYFKTK